MTDDGQNGGKVTDDLKDYTVPDASHPRFNKQMCRCTEEKHVDFPLSTLKKHFSDLKHNSVCKCTYCGGNNVYEYSIADRNEKKVYHFCPSNSADSVQEEGRSYNELISQSIETSDTASSGIGTGNGSMVSIFSGKSCDNQSTSGLSTDSYPLCQTLKSMHNDTPNGSHKD